MLKQENINAAVDVYKIMLGSFRKSAEDMAKNDPSDMFAHGSLMTAKALEESFCRLFGEDMPC